MRQPHFSIGPPPRLGSSGADVYAARVEAAAALVAERLLLSPDASVYVKATMELIGDGSDARK